MDNANQQKIDVLNIVSSTKELVSVHILIPEKLSLYEN